MPDLFSPLPLRSVTLKNRTAVSPMCMYSSRDGHATDFHLVHLGQRAMGGFALIIAEATAVTPDGRISPEDAGLWTDSQIEPLARITRFLKAFGSVPGIQLAHAGRKASTGRPFDSVYANKDVPDEAGGWPTVAPSPVPFAESFRTPRALTVPDIRAIQGAFVAAAHRALTAGYELIELHAAHGYLAHEFLSPLSNHRNDEYGGSFENRTRFVREIVEKLRAAWPDRLPLAVRLSCTDWAEGGWDLSQSVELARQLNALGVDLVDCSSGGMVPHAKIQLGPGYQVPFAAAIKRDAAIATAAVGLITEPHQANAVIAEGQADLILLARGTLRDPYWPHHAARVLGQPEAIPLPAQYGRA